MRRTLAADLGPRITLHMTVRRTFTVLVVTAVGVGVAGCGSGSRPVATGPTSGAIAREGVALERTVLKARG